VKYNFDRSSTNFQISRKSVLLKPTCCVQTETDGQAATTKPIVAFRSFANAPKNKSHHIGHGSYLRNST